MQQRIMDRWIEAAEARRVCVRAIAEQMPARPVAPMPQPLSPMEKLRAMVMFAPTHRDPAFAPNGEL
jgi:hypothetical protein